MADITAAIAAAIEEGLEACRNHPAEPTDEELLELWSRCVTESPAPWPTPVHRYARAVLARWGQPSWKEVARG